MVESFVSCLILMEKLLWQKTLYTTKNNQYIPVYTIYIYKMKTIYQKNFANIYFEMIRFFLYEEIYWKTFYNLL